MKIASPRSTRRLAFVAAAVLTLMASQAQAQAQTARASFEFKKPKLIQVPGDLSFDTSGASAPFFNPPSSPYLMGFEGISQYDGASFSRNFIPPDTIGAVGKTQFMETTNGAYAIFDKTTGNRTSLVSDVNFWAASGQTGTSGDSRVMYNANADRWVVVAFGANAKDLQVAVSDTANALGPWKSVKFEGYAGLGFGAMADYPTLALDKNAVYIGTNNFAPDSSGGTNSFRGTTLNVIPMNSLFNPAAPTVTNMKQFVTPYVSGGLSNVDAGYAIQGVNSNSVSTAGRVATASLFDYDNVTYQVNGLTATSATGATTTAAVYVGQAANVDAGAARQPAVAVPGNARVVDTLDTRVSSSVYEANGRIYMVQTVDAVANGLDQARVRYTVLDATTNAILDQGDIGAAGFDYFQGSIAVNAAGQVTIGYNRSGSQAADLNGDGLADGNVSFMAQTFNTGPGGQLVSSSGELLLKTSLIDDYHNGSTAGGVATGRQRWGDYSQVTVDPDNPQHFYLIGEFAREYNNPASGHPGGTGGSRWGTWVAVVDAGALPVPEPTTWLMMVFGLGAVAAMARRRAAQGIQAA